MSTDQKKQPTHPTRLAAAIRDSGMTFKSFSEASGIPYPSLRDYARGVKKPGLDAFAAIIRASGVSADWILTGKGAMRDEPQIPASDTSASTSRQEELQQVGRVLAAFDGVQDQDVPKVLQRVTVWLLNERGIDGGGLAVNADPDPAAAMLRYGTNRSTSIIKRDLELRQLIHDCAKSMGIDGILHECQERLGVERCPSRSALGRYIRKLRESVGLNGLR